MRKIKINADVGLLILRLSVGVLMLLHGIPKLIHGLDFIQQLLVSKGMPGFIAYGVYLGEIVAPLLIIIGYKTRIAAVVFVINMLTIIGLMHTQDIFAFGEYGGMKLELIYLYLSGTLALFFTGAGKYAVSRKSMWD